MCNVQLQPIIIIVTINVIIIVIVLRKRHHHSNQCLICATPELTLCRYILVHSSGKCNLTAGTSDYTYRLEEWAPLCVLGIHLSSQSSVVAPRVSIRSYRIGCFQIIYQSPSPDCSLIVGTDGMLSETVLTWR